MKHLLQTVICSLALVISANAQNLVPLHEFGNGSDGAQPYSGVILDPLGNMYGTTYTGGAGRGIVYKLNAHVETILHKFFDISGGLHPMGPLTEDAAGNLYGTTQIGGDSKSCPNLKNPGASGCGVVFKLAGKVETVLYEFHNGADGKYPVQGLTIDSTGNLFGSSDTAIFEIQNGKFTIIASVPVLSNLLPDGQGNLYGISADNNLFEVSVATGLVTILYTFQGMGVGDGLTPMGSLISDASGNIYGTTEFGGVPGCPTLPLNPLHGVDLGCGTLYKWSQGVETVLYRFQPTPAPHNPQFGVIQDAAGNFYGVTAALAEDEGDIYEVTSQGTEVTLHSFKGPRDGGFPQGSLVLGGNGTLYGTSSLFGKYGQGTVYSYCICK
jgi:uncharacterized repeat protein (TIGR03803 family)